MRGQCALQALNMQNASWILETAVT